MTLYIEGLTEVPDLVIDFFEVYVGATGEHIVIDWDESEQEVESGVFKGWYDGVNFNGEPATDRLRELETAEITAMQIHSCTVENPTLVVKLVELDDIGECYHDENPTIGEIIVEAP